MSDTFSSTPVRPSAFAPFRLRAFRFQWVADLATSCAFEMETLILSWYVLVETKSVLLLTAFASLQFLGTLIAPLMGVVADRIGHRNLLAGMRLTYATLATTLMTLTFAGLLSPLYVFVIATLMGLVRPSDMGMRAAVLGDIMPSAQLMSAMGIQRTTQDSAKIAGALSGAGLVAALGMGPAYVVVAAFYTMSFLLTLYAGRLRGRTYSTKEPVASSPWGELKEGIRYVWSMPYLLATMCLAFLVNMTAFPLLFGLQAYVAKEIYHTDQTGLGYMTAAASVGALAGSLVMSRHGLAFRPARLMVYACLAWFVFLFAYTQMSHPAAGIPFLVLAGCASSVSQVPMNAMILRLADEQFRGRVMGIRMLAIYGNTVGLVASGPLIAAFGYAITGGVFCVLGFVCTVLIVVRWRTQLWRKEAPGNRR